MIQIADNIEAIMAGKNYKFFTKGDYNLNIIAVRDMEGEVNTFCDSLYLIYKISGIWQRFRTTCTTRPGLWELQHPSFPAAQSEGTAILAEQQMAGAYKLGWHGSGKYLHEALIQVKPCYTWRDNNRDNKFDYENGRMEWTGCNIHRAAPNYTVQTVDNWSAGCTVSNNKFDFDMIISIVRKAIAIYGNSFTYTILSSNDCK